MPMTKDQLLAEAKALGPEEREALAEELWLSLDAERRDEIDAAWAEKIERRIDAYDKGEVQATSPDEMFRRLRQKYGA